jgi:site-specific recombinase XerD
MKIKEFLKSINGLSENTRKSYEQTLYQLHRAIDGEEPTAKGIEQFLSKYKTVSLHRHKAAIKTYWEWRWKNSNPPISWPFGRHEFTAFKRDIPRYFPPERVDELMSTLNDKNDTMAIKTLFQLGARISEMMAITWENITPVGVKVFGKGGKIALIPTTKDFNKELVKFAGKKRGKIFNKPYSYYYKLLKNAGAAIGVPDISPHMLRHARAVDLIRKKMPMVQVQQFLRHANFNTTAIYLEITGGELVDQLEIAESNGKGVPA